MTFLLIGGIWIALACLTIGALNLAKRHYGKKR